MPKSITELRNRKVNKEEVKEKSAKGKQALEAEQIFRLFADVQIGEAVEFGGFVDEDEGKNFLAYWMPDTLKRLRSECGWGKNEKGEDIKNGNKLAPVTTAETHPDPEEEGKIAMWVIRVK